MVYYPMSLLLLATQNFYNQVEGTILDTFTIWFLLCEALHA